MARTTLESPGEDVLVGGEDVNVIGTTEGGEVITIVDTDAGTNVELDSSFSAGGDTLNLEGEAETYSATISGSRVILTSAAGTTVSIPVGTEGIALNFGGDDLRVLSVVDGEVVIGDQVIAADGDTQLDEGNDGDGPVTVAEALATLQAAEQALADFEEEEGTADSLRDDRDDAEDALAAARDVQSDAQIAAAQEAADANAEAAQLDVDAVEGLGEAIAVLAAAEAAEEAADEALAEAQEDETIALAVYNARNPTDQTNQAQLDNIELDDDGVWTGTVVSTDGALIVIDPDTDEPALAPGITEATNPGVTDLLNAVVATEVAENAEEAAAADTVEAQAAVDALDNAQVDAAEAAIDSFDSAVNEYNNALENYTAIQSAANIAALEAAYDELIANGVDDELGDDDTAGDIFSNDTAGTNIQAEITEREGELDDDLTDAQAEPTLTETLENAQDAQDAANAAAEARDDLIAEEAAAQEMVDQAEALEADVEAATDAVEELGLGTPNTVDGDETATAGNDLFVAGDSDGSIADFGESGEDTLFVGPEYTIVMLDDDQEITDNVGEVDVLEIFVKEIDGDTVLFIEEETFDGNVSDGSFGGSTIVLEDVDASNVDYDPTGLITVEDMPMA